MKKQMHLAAQYLAAAGISFLEKKADDSHTNLGFNTGKGCLESHFLSENKDQLQLCYQSFSLRWKSKDEEHTLPLDGKSHREILEWITQTAQTAIGKSYHYHLHYELPYDITDDFVYKMSDAKALADLMHMRILTQLSLEQIIKDEGLEAEIRIWPHHFDTGIYTALPDSNISVGLGLAIPDSVSDTHYLYASGYSDEGQIDTSNFKDLSRGYWSNQGFNGAVLSANLLTRSEGVAFFEETIHHFKNHS